MLKKRNLAVNILTAVAAVLLSILLIASLLAASLYGVAVKSVSAKSIAAAIEKRQRRGKRFSIIAVAEGAISKEEAKMSKKEFKAALEEMAMTEETFMFILSNSILNNEAYAAMITSDEKYTDEEKAQIKEIFQKVAELNALLDKYDIDVKMDWAAYSEAYSQYFGMMLY